jgi:hypothetical protein
MVNVADLLVPAYEPEMTTAIVDCGLCVRTVNVALVAPAGMVTLDGTVAKDVLLLASATTTPPDGAGAVKLTRPVEESLPRTVVGFRVSDNKVGPAPGGGVRVGVAAGVDVAVGVGTPEGRRVSVAVLVTPAPVTEIVTVVVVVTGVVLMRKPPATANCGTWTLDGTLATAGLLLARRK